MNLFQRSGAYLKLSPGERAFLRLIEGLIVSAVIAGVQAVMPLLNAANGQLDPSAVPWASVVHTFIATVMAALGLSVVKFFKAQGDGPLATPPSSPAAVPSVAAAAAAVAAVPTVPPIVGAIPAAAAAIPTPAAPAAAGADGALQP